MSEHNRRSTDSRERLLHRDGVYIRVRELLDNAIARRAISLPDAAELEQAAFAALTGGDDLGIEEVLAKTIAL